LVSTFITLVLRPYQECAVVALNEALVRDKHVLAVAPTGSGKTVIAATLISRARRWRRVLWLAHRMELIGQARQQLVGLGVPCGVRCAKYEEIHPEHVDANAFCQVGSVQTIVRRKDHHEDVDLIVFDEAHHAMADTYQEIAQALPNAEVLGLTATPCRKDGRGLGDFFVSMNNIVKPSELYADKYLCNPVTYLEDEDMVVKGLRGARLVGGDFAPASMSVAVDKSDLIGNVVRQAIRLVPGVPKVVFAATVQHSKRIAARFYKAGVKAVHLDASHTADERRQVLEALSAGHIEVVTNVDLFLEGWDPPVLGAVILARPTKSLARLIQMIGRVQHGSGFDQKIVLDHGANCTRLQYIPGEDVEWTLKHGAPKRPDTDTEVLVKACVECRIVISWRSPVCPQCGAEQPQMRTRREILKEREADLVRLERERFEKKRDELRTRAKKVAVERGLDDTWVERVIEGEMPRPAEG
jgi:DNA repair protein RadD